ncbi:MAG: hypothetical protein J0L73_04685 [Verrucomicrobia bacterium]|nr:hypothetical protein [Verrucomicrobiota bacterium]
MIPLLLETAAADQVTDQVSDQVKALLKGMGTKPVGALECMKKLGLSHRPPFRQNYLQPALDAGLIGRTLPESRTAGCRSTGAGRCEGWDLLDPRLERWRCGVWRDQDDPSPA